MNSALLSKLKLHAFRVIALSTSSIVAYKGVVAAFSRFIPGEPLHGFGVWQWLKWMIGGGELVFLLLLTTFEYCAMYFLARRISLASLIVWGGLLGPYVALCFYPFDWWHVIDTLPPRLWPPGIFGASLEIVILLGVLPLGLLMLIMTVERSLTMRHRTSC